MGRIGPELGERAPGEGGLYRDGPGPIADPDLPNKIASGNRADVRPCLLCNCCTDLRGALKGIHCQVNAAAGREKEYSLTLAVNCKRVVVVGGGPGMEAARVARMRGHQVTLLPKKGTRLGGQLVIAAVPPHKGSISSFAEYLEAQIRKLGVEIRLGRQIDGEDIDELKPDVIIVATGGVPFRPGLPGIDGVNTVAASEVLLGREAGNRVVIIGGELVGCEVADYLAGKGKAVTVCELAGKDFAEKMPASLRVRLIDRLAQQGVKMRGGVKYEQIPEDGLIIIGPGANGN